MGYNITMDEALKGRLLQEITIRFPYTYDEVKYVYDSVKSIDTTIRVCEASAKGGYSSPTGFANIIRSIQPQTDLPRIPHNVDLLNV